MKLSIPFRPKLVETWCGYTAAQFQRDAPAGLNVMTLAFPHSIAFAIASGVQPKMGSIIRFIPYPVSRAFTKGIAVLILSSQIKSFLGLSVDQLPVDFVGKIRTLAENLGTVHWPTITLSVVSVAMIGLWPARLSRYVPGAMAGLLIATAAVALGGLHEQFDIATISSAYGSFSGGPPVWQWPLLEWDAGRELIQPAFTIALLVAMQALLGTVVTDGLIDDRHVSNPGLISQGLANLVGPLFGCLPVTGAVARSVFNVRAGVRTPVAESTETGGSQHSLVGKRVPEGVLIFRVFGAFFFGAVDKLDDELKRARREPEILILRVRKVLAMDATGLQALEDLRAKLHSKGKHLILSAPHTQPLSVMINSGFIDRLGQDNVCPHITAALARAREILKLPPVQEQPEVHERLYSERQSVEAARRELTVALDRAQHILKTLDHRAEEVPTEKP